MEVKEKKFSVIYTDDETLSMCNCINCKGTTFKRSYQPYTTNCADCGAVYSTNLYEFLLNIYNFYNSDDALKIYSSYKAPRGDGGIRTIPKYIEIPKRDLKSFLKEPTFEEYSYDKKLSESIQETLIYSDIESLMLCGCPNCNDTSFKELHTNLKTYVVCKNTECSNIFSNSLFDFIIKLKKLKKSQTPLAVYSTEITSHEVPFIEEDGNKRFDIFLMRNPKYIEFSKNIISPFFINPSKEEIIDSPILRRTQKLEQNQL